jgi:hypothetical protein
VETVQAADSKPTICKIRYNFIKVSTTTIIQ